MIQTHTVPVPGTQIPTHTGEFLDVDPKGKGLREWTFLPPVVAMWCRADGMPAVQVRDNTQLLATRISLASYCIKYDWLLAGILRWGATVVEANPGEYKPGDPRELVYDSVTQITACPQLINFLYAPAGWGTALTLTAYGGNNDGAVCGLVEISRIGSTQRDRYFLTSPGVLRIERYFLDVQWTRMDWTGGANWATVDGYVTNFSRTGLIS